jgi:hypothetical protein
LERERDQGRAGAAEALEVLLAQMVGKTGIVEAPRHGRLPAGDGLSGERAGRYLPDHPF